MDAAQVEVLAAGIRAGGTFAGADLAGIGLGTGRALDALASLRDSGMLELGRDGTFSVTDAARRTLWDAGVPLQTRILRLLRSGSYTGAQISRILGDGEGLEGALESLRAGGLAVLSPQRRGGRVEGAYGLLPGGRSRLLGADIEAMLGQIEEEVRGSQMGAAERGRILGMLGRALEAARGLP